jgi:hypothetical protein
VSTKLLDNTILTALGKEIRSMDVFPRIYSHYGLIITEDVENESINGRYSDRFLKDITIFRESSDMYHEGIRYKYHTFFMINKY